MPIPTTAVGGRYSPDRFAGGFEYVVRRMAAYADRANDTGKLLPVTSPSFLQAFLDASYASSSMRKVRGPANHFSKWLGSEDAWFVSDAETLDRFRLHQCTAEGRFANTAHPQLYYVNVIARVLLYLQYQGLSPSYGWTGDDWRRCVDFRNVLIVHGLPIVDANNQALHGAHLVLWARLNGLSRAELTQSAIDRFLAHNCRCGLLGYDCEPIASYRVRRRRGAIRFLRFLANEHPVMIEGLPARVTRKPPPQLSEPVAAYRAWLVQHKGLRSSTVKAYLEEIAGWQHRLGDDAALYTALHIRAIARIELEGKSPTRQSRFITVMRSYIAFRAARGDCPAALVHALISRPVYRMGTIPKSLPFETLRSAIASCDTKTITGIRDRAVLTLLLETGMRANEVAQLRLGDLDWEAAQIAVRGKGGRAGVMPLTQAAGDAILDWLERARPVTDDEGLFVRLRPPHTSLVSHGAVTHIVVWALKRANLKGTGGAHLFRHGLARQLLKAGSGLPDIATVLRHESLMTTMIYAKVDEPALMSVAQEWPGEAS